MKRIEAHITSAIATALIWALTWATITVLFGIIADLLTGFTLEKHVDPMAAMAFPGFILGLIFYAVIILSKRGGSLSELSLLSLTAWGAGIGCIMALLSTFMGTLNPIYPPWQIILTMTTSSTLLSAVSAAATGIVVRLLHRHRNS